MALLNEEPGSSAVEALLDGAVISSGNWCEAFGKLRARGLEATGITTNMDGTRIEILAFDETDARTAGELTMRTRSAGLSLADRACLALASRGLVLFDQLDYSDLRMDPEVMPALPLIDFSRAKSVLSDVMTRVVHEHRPSVVSRHRGKERMVLLRTDDLVRYLDSFRFKLELVGDGGEVTGALPRLGLLRFGARPDADTDEPL